MKDNVSRRKGIPPGFYTLEGLAKISSIAKRLLERVKADSEKTAPEPTSTGRPQTRRIVLDEDEGLRFRRIADEGTIYPIRED